MSDIINSSLDVSPLNKTLLNVGLTDPFKAKVYPSPIPSAKIQNPVLATGSLGYNSIVKIDFPRSGNNILSYLKINLTGIASNVNLGFAGIIFLFKSISLYQGDVLIETILPEDTLARILSDSNSQRNGMLSTVGSYKSGPSFGNLFYPLYFSCFEQLKNSLDTKVLQQFSLVLETCNSIYDIAYTSSVDSTISSNRILDFQDNNWAVGFYDDGSIRTISATDPRSRISYVTIGTVVISAVSYTKVSIFSITQNLYFTPTVMSSVIYYWYIPTTGVQYLMYADDNVTPTVILGSIYFSKIAGTELSYPLTIPTDYLKSPVYIPANSNVTGSIDNIVISLIELKNVVVVPQQPNLYLQEKEQFQTKKPLLSLWNSNDREINFSSFTKNVNDNITVGAQPPATAFTIFSTTYNKYLEVAFANAEAINLNTNLNGELTTFYIANLSTSANGLVSASFNAFDSINTDYFELSLNEAPAPNPGTELWFYPDNTNPPNAVMWNLIPTENGIMLQDVATGKLLYWNNNVNQPFTTVQPVGINPEIFLIEPVNHVFDEMTFEVPVNNRKLVHSTRFMVKQLTDLSIINKTPLATANIPIDGHYVEIDTVEFFVDNELVWRKSASEFNAMTNRDYNRIKTNWNSNNTLDNIFTHEYGLSVSLTENSGAVNFSYLTDAKFKVKCKDLSFGKYKLTVIHNIWNEFSTDGSDGKMILVHGY